MGKHLLSCGLLVLSLLTASARQVQGQENKAGGALQVRVDYSGSGRVDTSHKIYVALWDSPAFTDRSSNGQVIPVQIQAIDSKKGETVFKSVSKSPAYVSVVYDPSGQWDAQSGPPPSGSSLGLYSKEPGKAAPIDVKAGETASVEVKFDDSVKMP